MQRGMGYVEGVKASGPATPLRAVGSQKEMFRNGKNFITQLIQHFPQPQLHT